IADDVRFGEQIAPRDQDALEAGRGGKARSPQVPRPPKGVDRNYPGGGTRGEAPAAPPGPLGGLREFARRGDAALSALLPHEQCATVERYEALKLRAGRLDFLDLLLRTRDLVRDRADVRALLQHRFTHIFVDEFQDTDPLQAEILLLLAAADPDIADWHAAR